METASGSESWLTGELLEPLVDVNVHCLELLRQRVRGARAGTLPRVLEELAPAWAALGDVAIGRIARVPYTLVESSFAGRPDGHAAQVREGGEEAVFFEREQLPGLVRELVVLAWHVARTRRQAARMMLGMEPRQIDRVAGCTLRELERLADAGSLEVRLRWSDRPAVWRHALAAAANADEPALARAKLRGLQLLAAEHWRDERD